MRRVGTRTRLGGAWGRGLLIAAALALGACATTRDRMGIPMEPDWTVRRELLRGLDDWELQGRIALSAGEEGWNGTLSWRQDADDLDFRFRGPLGIGGFRIHGDRAQLRVKTTSGDVFFLTDPEAELRAKFGWSIPVHSMRYWVLGVPDPEASAEETVDGMGLLSELEQSGWIVHYQGYRDFGGMILPRKVVMLGDDVRIRVAVDRWDIRD